MIFSRRELRKQALLGLAGAFIVTLIFMCAAHGEVIGGRPAGCPHAFCGCGLRKFLGISDGRLDLAWNWARLFRRTTFHDGAVAVWRHHVAYVERVTGPRTAILRDYN